MQTALVRTLILVAVSICVSILFAEMLLRKAVPVFMGSVAAYRVPHPVVGWVLEPGASYLYKIPETTVHVSYNSRGQRDTEHSVGNDRNAFRIVVLGEPYGESTGSDISVTGLLVFE